MRFAFFRVLTEKYKFLHPQRGWKERVQGTRFPAGGMGIGAMRPLSGFGMAEIGNRKERLRVREAGASAAGRGQRPYASFPESVPRYPRVLLCRLRRSA